MIMNFLGWVLFPVVITALMISSIRGWFANRAASRRYSERGLAWTIEPKLGQPPPMRSKRNKGGYLTHTLSSWDTIGRTVPPTGDGTMSNLGKVIGYANGYFGDSFHVKRIEAEGFDWVVARGLERDAKPEFANFEGPQYKDQLIAAWEADCAGPIEEQITGYERGTH